MTNDTTKKGKLTLSIDASTRDRLAQYAKDHHTSISQAITDWIWRQKVSDPQIRGQMSLKC